MRNLSSIWIDLFLIVLSFCHKRPLKFWRNPLFGNSRFKLNKKNQLGQESNRHFRVKEITLSRRDLYHPLNYWIWEEKLSLENFEQVRERAEESLTLSKLDNSTMLKRMNLCNIADGSIIQEITTQNISLADYICRTD